MVRAAEQTETCRYCNTLIAFSAPLGYWYHVETWTVYCDMTAMESLRATPGHPHVGPDGGKHGPGFGSGTSRL